MRTCKLVLLNEVDCVFVGLHPDHIGYLWQQFSEFAPNYFFNPKFKLGQWDGKVRYFHKTGKTHINLLDDILPVVSKFGYKITTDDRRDGTLINAVRVDEMFFARLGVVDPATGEPWIMRDYQVELDNTLIDKGGGVGLAGTGSGKTSMTAALAKAYELGGDARSIIIVPDKNLTRQTFTEYQFFQLDVGEYSGSNKDINHQHVVSTWQALKNNPSIIQQFPVLIVDECHGLKGNVLPKLINEYGCNIVYRFGVTATLPKEPADALAVKISVGPVRYTVPSSELIERKVLSDLNIHVIQHDINLQEAYQDYLSQDFALGEKPSTYKVFKNQYFPEWAAEKRYLQNHKGRLKTIVDLIIRVSGEERGNTLCLVNGVDFGKKLAALIPDSEFIYSKDDVNVRKELFDRYKTENHVVGIATAQLASTGLNIPRIFNIVYIDVGKSFIRVIQSIGRGLRKAHDKDFVNVWDIGSDFKHSKNHTKERMKYYKESKYPHEHAVVPIE